MEVGFKILCFICDLETHQGLYLTIVYFQANLFWCNGTFNIKASFNKIFLKTAQWHSSSTRKIFKMFSRHLFYIAVSYFNWCCNGTLLCIHFIKYVYLSREGDYPNKGTLPDTYIVWRNTVPLKPPCPLS